MEDEIYPQRAYSIKTRIKTLVPLKVYIFTFTILREHIPLKQGLRQVKNLFNVMNNDVSESIFH